MLANGDSLSSTLSEGFCFSWNFGMECASRGTEGWQRRGRYFQAYEGDATACPTGQPSRGNGQRSTGLSSRTLGSGIGRDHHPYISITPLCTPSVFPLYSAFLFSVRLVSSLRVSCVSLYFDAILIVVGAGPIAGIIYCSVCLLSAHLFMLWFHFESSAIPSVFYLEDILFVWFCSCLD